MAAGVSVLICCYNSAGRLPATLNHLLAQQLPAEIKWELVVVDNASTDNTSEIAAQSANDFQKKKINLKVLREPQPGKNNALHTGITASLYNFILICDDDNWLAANYIAKAYYLMQNNPAIGAAGGQGVAAADQPLPEWFGQYRHGYAVGEQNPVTGDVSEKGYLWGAGMIFRKNLYASAYLKFPSFLTGPNADTLARGEDVEFCMRIVLAGYKLFYDETLTYQHYIPSQRLTVAYRDKLFKGYDYEKRILDLYARQIRINKLSWSGRQQLLLASLLRYSVSWAGRWNKSFEADMIHLLAGFRLPHLSNEAKQMRQLNLQLISKTLADA